MKRYEGLWAALFLLFYLTGIAALGAARTVARTQASWTRPNAIAQGSDPIPAARPVFGVMDDLGPAATERDYVHTAILLDDRLGEPDLAGVHYLAANDDLAQSLVARLNEIERATPVRSYKTFTGGEAAPFMTDSLQQTWPSEETLPTTRSIWRQQRLEDKLIGVQVKNILFTPDRQMARADYLRVTRITGGDPAILQSVHRVIGGTRTESHVYWFMRSTDGVWRIIHLSDPIS